MNAVFKNGGVIIQGGFDVKKTFECGQCFRFENRNGYYDGVAYGKYIKVYEMKDGVFLENVTEDEYNERFSSFFDMETDYDMIESVLMSDAHFAQTVPFSHGIRILRQQPWEALCSFIISQNNNIPRIKKIIAALCDNYGDIIEGTEMKTFPSAAVIAAAGTEGISVIRSGFRAKYIIDAAEKVASGEIDLDAVKSMPIDRARAELIKIKGVGAKVADCVLLFSLGFTQAFPVDVWVKRVISGYYGDDFTPEIFGQYAGVAQQYLFYYERNGNCAFVNDVRPEKRKK